jgi:lysophospholipase L1-like esterase
MSDKKRVMCFGDSLTWGWVPTLAGAPTTRYPFAERWTGVMAKALGAEYEILEEGLSARTTDLDDPNDARLNGSKHLPAALASHFPLELVVVMLGTNDTKAVFRRTPYEIANGLSKLLIQILTSAGGVGTVYGAPKVLVVCPPPLADMPHVWFQGMFEGGTDKTRQMPRQYEALCSFFSVDYLDAGTVMSTNGCDGIHFTVEDNAVLGTAVAVKINAMMAAN